MLEAFGAKTRPRRSQDALETMLKLKLDFGTILVGFSSQLGLQNRPKSSKNRGQDAFDFYVYFLMVFSSIFEGFLLPKRSQLGIKFIEKSTLTSKGQFSRKPLKTNGFSMFFLPGNMDVMVERQHGRDGGNCGP